MKNLSCYGSYDGDNAQCIRCNDMDCIHITDEKMEREVSPMEDLQTACSLLRRSVAEIDSKYGVATVLSTEIRNFLALVD